jgi:hypothetical protein
MRQLETDALEQLARAISDAASREAMRVKRERLEAEMRTKQRPRTPQAEPQGLFAQTQLTLVQED